MAPGRRVLPALAIGLLAAPATADAARDRDRDRLPDRWERRHDLSTRDKSGRGDPDSDALRTRREYRLRLHPRRADTDRDGLRDRAELRRFETDPRRRDTDGDGAWDGSEVRAGTDPRRRAGRPRPAAGGTPPAPDAPGAPGASGGAPGGSGYGGPGGAPPLPPAPARCDRTANPASLGGQLAAASAGQTICVAAGDYGGFGGARKSGLVTVRPAAGATASMSLRLDGASNVAIQGFTIRGGSISGSTRDVVIRDSLFTSALTISGLAGANVLLERNTHRDIDAPGQFESPARIHLAYASGTHSGVTIRSSLLAGGDADGVQSGVGVDIIGNEFRDIRQKGPNHTDAIQLLGAPRSVVRGNYIHRSTTGIVAYDGLAGALIEDNVVDLDGQPWGIELYSDDGSIVRHNTLPYRAGCWYGQPCGQIDLNRKSSDDAGRGTVVVDNVATSIALQNGSSAAQRHHNLVRRNAAGGDLTGVPAFAGGALPGSLAGFGLAPGSPGKGAASDGGDVGVRP